MLVILFPTQNKKTVACFTKKQNNTIPFLFFIGEKILKINYFHFRFLHSPQARTRKLARC